MAGQGSAIQTALSLKRVFGFNKDIVGGVQDLTDQNRKAIFYVSGHTGVIFDYESRSQRLLQGHGNAISCAAVSKDKQWIVTADAGEDSMCVVWNSYTGTPVKTIFSPHKGGVGAVDISSDALYVVTLSHNSSGTKTVGGDDGESYQEPIDPQELSIWEWTVPGDSPLHSAVISSADEQDCVRFHTDDAKQLVTNGSSRVVFWSWDEGSLKFFAPPISSKDFQQPVGRFTQTVYLPDSSRAVTGTVDGDIVLWDQVYVADQSVRTTEKRAAKIIRLHNSAINYLIVYDKFVVSGGADGYVRFFDFKFRILAWYEDLHAGPITSVCFADPAAFEEASGFNPKHEEELRIPNFIVGTKNSLILFVNASVFEELESDQRRGEVIVEGQDARVTGLACHPKQMRFAVVGYSGVLQLWDYGECVVLGARKFDKLKGQCLGFDPEGQYLAVGFTNGTLKLLSATTLDEVQSFRVSGGSITDLTFSHDAQYLATADEDRCVALYRFTYRDEDDTKPVEWVFIGKHRSHSKAITGLQFSPSSPSLEENVEDLPRLLSVGEDHAIVEYDLQNSFIKTGVKLKSRTKTELTAIPTGLLFSFGAIDESATPSIIVANSEYKLKVYGDDHRKCRRTVLGPTYGGPINRMIAMECEDNRYVTFSTMEKVIGVMKLPLDGNPSKTMGLIAHAGEVTSMVSSLDGRYLITAGGSDYSVFLWKVQPEAIEASIALGGDTLRPYLELIEGGPGGEFYDEIRNYFYYAQLRSQGEETTRQRKIEGTVPISQVPNLMRALGFYPTEHDIRDLISELEQSHPGGVDLPTLIRVYVNHRPVFGISKADVRRAFETIAKSGRGELSVEDLFQVLQDEGEQMSSEEIQQCFQHLVGSDGGKAISLNQKIGPTDFAEKILGFEDYSQTTAEIETIQ